MGKGECECEEGACGRAGELGQGLGFVQGQMIWLHLGQSFLQVQRALLLTVNGQVVLGHLATSTRGCSVDMKWWRTIAVIASFKVTLTFCYA